MRSVCTAGKVPANGPAKVSSTYTVRSSHGGFTTIALSLICIYLIWTELGSYFAGVQEQQFSVNSDVGTDMQLNVDVTVAMPCSTLHVNVQDTSGDRLLAAELLQMEPAAFDLRSTHELTVDARESDDDLETVFRRAKAAKKFRKTKHAGTDACRIFGSLKLNKVTGDFHITAKNYGYMDESRSAFVTQGALNFSHVIDEFSFGEYYPKLENPLDGVAAIIEAHLFRYQYFLSVVPTTYRAYSGSTIVTNQYAVTEQPQPRVHPMRPPGIFFKYDIEPLGLTIQERRVPFLQFLVRLVNVVGGVVVCTGWLYPVFEAIVTPAQTETMQTMLDKGVKD